MTPTLEKPTLTNREKEILQCFAEGLSNKQIAERFCCSEFTVKSHTSNIFVKLEARTRAEAAEKAIREGLV